VAKKNVEPKGGAGPDALAGFADDLGRVLGTATSRATAWLDQRKTIAEQLTQIRDTANRYLHELAGISSRSVAKGKKAVSPSERAQPKRRRRKMSAEARHRIAEAQRKRWAKVRAGKS
jgi:hypothetical protein